MKTLGFVTLYIIFRIGSAVNAVTRRELVIDTLLSRTSPKALSSSADATASVVDLSEPFDLPKGLQGPANQEDIFTRWKGHYGFNFNSANDEATVKDTFTKNLNDVVEHNQKFDSGLETYWKTLNGYSGLEESDFVLLRTGLDTKRMKKIIRKLKSGSRLRSRNGGRLNLKAVRALMRTKKSTTTKTTKTTTTKKTTKKATTTPASTVSQVIADYTTSQAYPGVRDQGQCGSCWAFAAVAAMEFQINTLYNVSTTDLSEQQLVNCDKSNWGCNGGLPDLVYGNLISNTFGVTTESSYPYTATDGTCSSAFKAENHKVSAQTGNVGGTGWGTGTEADIENLAKKGPVVVAMYATTLGSYGGGIFKGCPAGSTPNHAVVVVGVGTLNGIPYWKIRNSWGANWGDKGHFYMLRSSKMCSIQYYFIVPTVVQNS